MNCCFRLPHWLFKLLFAKSRFRRVPLFNSCPAVHGLPRWNDLFLLSSRPSPKTPAYPSSFFPSPNKDTSSPYMHRRESTPSATTPVLSCFPHSSLRQAFSCSLPYNGVVFLFSLNLPFFLVALHPCRAFSLVMVRPFPSRDSTRAFSRRCNLR